METVENRQNMGKNATQIMIFLLHYMWAENNYTTKNWNGTQGKCGVENFSEISTCVKHTKIL